jgi:hypothetical protein
MHRQVIEPPNTKDILRAAIKSYLHAPTIQIRQTRENNITVKKMWQKKSLAKLQSDSLGCQELQKSQSMQATIDSRADFRDMASNPKETIDQETEISDNVFPFQCNIYRKQQGQCNSESEFDTKIACDLAGLTNSPFSIDQRLMILIH